MNIKTYAFRLAITAIAFLVGFSAYWGFQKVGSLFNRLGNAVTAATPFQQSSGSPTAKNTGRASYNFTGKYFLSEENFPSGFTDFDHFELNTPIGAVYTDRTYRMRNITVDRESLAFETDANGGIGYRFSGRILLDDERDVKDLHESGVGDIIGKLEKVKNGRVVATMETRFFLFGT